MKKALIWSGLIFLIGLIQYDHIYLSIAPILFSIIFIYEKYKSDKINGINPLFLFIVSSLITSVGNLIGFLSQGSENEQNPIYFFSRLCNLHLCKTRLVKPELCDRFL